MSHDNRKLFVKPGKILNPLENTLSLMIHEPHSLGSSLRLDGNKGEVYPVYPTEWNVTILNIVCAIQRNSFNYLEKNKGRMRSFIWYNLDNSLVPDLLYKLKQELVESDLGKEPSSYHPWCFGADPVGNYASYKFSNMPWVFSKSAMHMQIGIRISKLGYIVVDLQVPIPYQSHQQGYEAGKYYTEMKKGILIQNNNWHLPGKRLLYILDLSTLGSYINEVKLGRLADRQFFLLIARHRPTLDQYLNIIKKIDSHIPIVSPWVDDILLDIDYSTYTKDSIHGEIIAWCRDYQTARISKSHYNNTELMTRIVKLHIKYSGVDFQENQTEIGATDNDKYSFLGTLPGFTTDSSKYREWATQDIKFFNRSRTSTQDHVAQSLLLRYLRDIFKKENIAISKNNIKLKLATDEGRLVFTTYCILNSDQVPALNQE